jgi:predicted DNA-binding protein with PD1-like motif
MQSQLLHEAHGERTFALILETGEEIMAALKSFAAKEGLTAAQITGIGAFSGLVLQYFDWDKKDYEAIPVGEQVEVASLIGDIAQSEDGPALHVHLVVGRRDGTALAGHLAEGHVRPTLELVIRELPAHLRRTHDPESGLALIRPQ